MFINFFLTLRRYKIPVTIRELLDLVALMKTQLIYANIDDFYRASRACMVKDEQHYDKFDRAFSAYFKGLDDFSGMMRSLIPDEWLRREFEQALGSEDFDKLNSIGGLEKLIQAFQEAQQAQEEAEARKSWEEGRGQEGTQEGQNRKGPKGKGGQNQDKEKKNDKNWRKRRFKDLDDSVELGTRNIKMALRRLRKLARTGREDELDMPGTIRSTAHNGGMLDIKMRPSRHNIVKVLCFFDIGGSMDAHVKTCEALFSATRTEFKLLESFYFHNFIYESVWKNSKRRHAEQMATLDVLHKYPHDYKVVFVGDATMAPYEITHVGGSVEHWNEEPGEQWLKRFQHVYDKMIWINPTPQDSWEYSSSVELTHRLVDGKMYPLTVKGIEEGMRYLSQ